jgi:hypothetical protein
MMRNGPDQNINLSRRQLLRASGAVAVGAGVGAAGLAGAAPASAALAPAPVGAAVMAARAHDPEFPDVPGMVGDRRANEFWYQFDQRTLYGRPRELVDAFIAISRYVDGGTGQERTFIEVWLDMARSSDYPANFTEFVTPIREPLAVVSRIQAEVFDRHYDYADPRLVAAFSWFGQGVLYDPRRLDVGAPVHTMNGDPPVGYPFWHVFIRSMMFLDIDRSRWGRIAPLNAFAWQLQTLAKPRQDAVNPPLPRRTVLDVAASWLPRSPRQLDIDFQSFPFPTPAGG